MLKHGNSGRSKWGEAMGMYGHGKREGDGRSPPRSQRRTEAERERQFLPFYDRQKEGRGGKGGLYGRMSKVSREEKGGRGWTIGAQVEKSRGSENFSG